MSRDDRYDVNAGGRPIQDDDPDALVALEDAGDVTAEDPDREVIEIRESIEVTRSNLSETIDEIQERLNPSHLKEQAIETVREATIGKVEDMVERASDTVKETRRNVVDTIKANPVPAALIGVGLAWMWWNGRGDSSRRTTRYGDRYRSGLEYDSTLRTYVPAGTTTGSARSQGGRTGIMDKATGAAGDFADKTRETVSGLVDQATETAGNLATRARDTVGNVVDQAQHQARRVEDGITVAMRENPLAVGAVALALGAAAGLALPLTRKENELMGPARDNLMDSAQSVAQETLTQVQQVAERVADEMGGTDEPSARGQRAGQSGQPGGGGPRGL